MQAREILNYWLMTYRNFDQSYDQVFKDIRKDLKLTQTEFARLLWITPGTVSNIEARRRRPSLQLLQRLQECQQKLKRDARRNTRNREQ